MSLPSLPGAKRSARRWSTLIVSLALFTSACSKGTDDPPVSADTGTMGVADSGRHEPLPDAAHQPDAETIDAQQDAGPSDAIEPRDAELNGDAGAPDGGEDGDAGPSDSAVTVRDASDADGAAPSDAGPRDAVVVQRDAAAGDSGRDAGSADASPCGNGILDPGEICDTAARAGSPSRCPTSCASQGPCHEVTLAGAGTCQARCVASELSSCASGDGCCPGSCQAPGDSDCTPAPYVESVYFVLDEPLYSAYASNNALFQRISADVTAVVRQTNSLEYRFAGILNKASITLPGTSSGASICSDPMSRPRNTYILVESADQDLSSSGGIGACVDIGGFQSGLRGRSIYAPGDPLYAWLIFYLAHELGHVATAGNPEYYEYSQLVDYSTSVPFSEVRLSANRTFDTEEQIWDDYFTEYVNDPMLRSTDRSRYGPLTALLVERDASRQYNNRADLYDGFWSTALQTVPVRVIGEAGQPLAGVRIEGYNYKGAAPSRQTGQSLVELMATTDAAGMATIDFMAKVQGSTGGWREARTIKLHKEGYVPRGIFVTTTMFEEAFFVQHIAPRLVIRLLPGSPTCLDSDGGEDTTVEGTLSYNVYRNHNIRTLDYTDTSLVNGVFRDYCWFGFVRKGSCVGSEARVRYVACPNGCSGSTGVCNP